MGHGTLANVEFAPLPLESSSDTPLAAVTPALVDVLDAALELARGLPEEATEELARALARVVQSTRRRVGLRGAPTELDLGPGTTWFRVQGQPRVVIETRRAMRALLTHLARIRVERPGEVVGAAELIRVGWPAEKMSSRSAHQRLHTLLCEMRKLGLRDVLVWQASGYRIDPRVQVRWWGTEEVA